MRTSGVASTIHRGRHPPIGQIEIFSYTAARLSMIAPMIPWTLATGQIGANRSGDPSSRSGSQRVLILDAATTRRAGSASSIFFVIIGIVMVYDFW